MALHNLGLPWTEGTYINWYNDSWALHTRAHCCIVVLVVPKKGGVFAHTFQRRTPHKNLSACPLRVGVEGHPSYEECPLRQMHATPLPSVGPEGTFLACLPGFLVFSRGLNGGVALAFTDSTIGGVSHWFALGYKHHLMDVALADSYGWVMWWLKKEAKPKPKAKSRKGKEKAAEEVEEVARGEE